ncbi:MAG: ECF-type sigma factor [Planctomycetota bacterium]
MPTGPAADEPTPNSAPVGRASDELLPLVYEELRTLAAVRLNRERSSQILQPTALVHEAFLRLLGPADGDGGAPNWERRGHFFAAAAEAMRRILIENARRAGRTKHGGGRRRVDLPEEGLASAAEHDAAQLLDLDAALSKLEREDPSLARLVELRFFAGLSVEDTAAALGSSPRTVKRRWAFARAWLGREMGET